MTIESESKAPVSRAEWGSDVIVEMMQQYGIEFAPTNLGGTFRGLLDSIVNFGDNKMPEVIECLHEEVAVCIAHGYARVAGKPLVALVHNVVGTLHAAMAIYDAYASHTPVIIMSGTGPMSLTGRRPWIDWVHTALVQGNLVRDYVKWDDQPHDPESFPESFMRAYRVAMTEPKGPVYLALDAGWQEAKLEESIALPDVSKYTPPTPMQADPEALRRAAELLAAAELPVIVAGDVGRNRNAVAGLVELAEAGSIPVVDAGGALNFPNTHPLDATDTDILAESDCVLLLDLDQAEASLTAGSRYTRGGRSSKLREGAKVISIGPYDVWIRSTIMDFGRLYPTEMTITADTTVALPALATALREELQRRSGAQGVLDSRAAKCRDLKDAARARWQAQAERESSERPIALSRIAREAWSYIKGEHWVLAGSATTWPRRVWEMERPGCIMGGRAAAALGTGLPKAVGAGLAAKQEGGFCVALQSDGDLLYVPTSIWTAVHHNIPILFLVLDNGGYIGEGGHVRWTSEQRDRSTDRQHIATEIQRPRVDFVAMAKSQGAYAEGPVEDPEELGPAIGRAFQAMKEQSIPAVVSIRCE